MSVSAPTDGSLVAVVGRLLAPALPLLLASCLISERPMITAEMADYPLPDGTFFSLHAWPERTTMQDVEGKTKTATLELVDGFYMLAETGSEQVLRFRLDRIGDSEHYVYMQHMDPASSESGSGAMYGIVSRIDGYFVRSYVDETYFGKYEAWLRENDPPRLVRYAGSYRRDSDGGFTVVTFESYDVLKAALADMAALGFYELQTGYRPTDAETVARLDAVDAELRTVDADLAKLYEERAQLEAAQRELCGGRICRELEDGRMIYRTDTYDPPMWYFRDGRLAPRELWAR